MEKVISGFAVKRGSNILGGGLNKYAAWYEAEREVGKTQSELKSLGYDSVPYDFDEIEQAEFGITYSRNGIDYGCGS